MTVDLHLHHVYGIRNDLSSILFFVDEASVVYPAGSNIILHNFQNNSQKFIPLSENGNSLTAMAVARGQFLAYAERTDPYGAIMVYDLAALRKKRTMITNEVASDKYIALDFADSGKQIIGVGGPPEYNLIYWWWEKTRILGAAKVGQEVRHVRVCPKDANRVAVCGPSIVRVFRLEDSQLRPEPKGGAKVNEYFDFVAMAWVNELRMLLGTSQGQIIIWEDGSLIADVLDPAATLSLHAMKLFRKQDAAISIDNILVHSNGFICTGGAGTLKNFEIAADGGYIFHKDMKILIEDKTLEYGILDEQQILDMTLSPAGDVVAVATDKRQIFSAKLKELKRTKEDYYKMKPLFYFLHYNRVHCVDICVRKPLIVTCAADRTIRIWNFFNRDCEIWKKFPEEPHSVAIHPNGFYLLSGFTDKLKMMHILHDDIKTVRDVPIRGCREVKFAQGGHLFAAANGAIIQIYTTIQFDNTMNLKGHTSRIRCILWSHDDTRIFSSSQDGSLFEWDLLHGEIIHEVTLRGSIFISLAAAPDGETVYGITSDGTLKEITNGTFSRDIKSPLGVLTSVNLSHAGHCLIFGTTEGKLLTLAFPLLTELSRLESSDLVWMETSAHQKDITKAILSHDSQLLITASSDGNVFVWKVVEGEVARILRRDKPSPYSDEILMEKKDLEKKNAHIIDLTTKTEEIQLENEYQKRAKDSLFSEKIKDITESFTKEIDLLKVKNEKQTMEKDCEAQQHQQDMTIMVAKFNHDLLEQERITNQKLLLEYEKYAELIIEKEKQESEFREQLQDVSASKEDAIERLTVHYETKIESLHSILDKTQKEFADYMKEHDEVRHMIEEDADMEIIDIRARYETAIFELKESNMRLKGENELMKKKSNNLLKDIDDHKAEVMKYQADLAKQMTVTKGLEKEIESWKKELKEREENVQDKEKRIHELKKKNQELEKFKFVLDFKIKELRKQIEPKDNEISEQSKQIKELERKIEDLDGKISNLKSEIHTQKTTLDFTRRDREVLGVRLKERDTFVRRFQGDMELAMEKITDPADLRSAFLRICEKYVRSSGKQVTSAEVDDSSVRELALIKETEKLRNNIADVKTQYQRKTTVLSSKLWKMMQQNSGLIEEINIFRQDITALRTRLALLDTVVQGTNPRRKDDYAKIQALLKDVEVARMEELSKAGVIELYRHELRRLHLLLILMREVIHNDCSPGVVELVAKLQDVQLPPVVGPSKIDTISSLVAEKMNHCMEDLAVKYPEVLIPSPIRKSHHRPPNSKPGEKTDGEKTDGKTKKVAFPPPELKAMVPVKQLQFLKNLIDPAAVLLSGPTTTVTVDTAASTTQLISAPQTAATSSPGTDPSVPAAP
ncbi:Cilia- and flagella-associated protein 57 [Hypsibius exemplaris]|uniref:Cilia- and flagella-associated protein 57 n=1 Tax=Hypsibius exemplaris TaxID=2072580 RepID=A0A1W0WFV7_HYPEX|nr:Cilia- and flagella-associated protein 57 [Hypsibius exemplaris]